jgi:hypothetical protein
LRFKEALLADAFLDFSRVLVLPAFLAAGLGFLGRPLDFAFFLADFRIIRLPAFRLVAMPSLHTNLRLNGGLFYALSKLSPTEKTLQCFPAFSSAAESSFCLQ